MAPIRKRVVWNAGKLFLSSVTGLKIPYLTSLIGQIYQFSIPLHATNIIIELNMKDV